MSKNYRESDKVPTHILCARLDELADAVTKGRDGINREFYMSIPAELDRDADVVICEASRRLKATEWISIKDRLPEFEESVLVFCNIYGRFISSYDRIGDSDFGQWHRGNEKGILPPTHWMPLPEIPS